VLTQAVWQAIEDTLPPHDGPRIVYGEASRPGAPRLKRLNAVFRQIPYDIRMR
jgi:adenine-specific DNA-methyltransferase